MVSFCIYWAWVIGFGFLTYKWAYSDEDWAFPFFIIGWIVSIACGVALQPLNIEIKHTNIRTVSVAVSPDGYMKTIMDENGKTQTFKDAVFINNDVIVFRNDHKNMFGCWVTGRTEYKVIK